MFWRYINSKKKDISQLEVPGENRLSESDEEKAESLLKNFTSAFTKEPDRPVSPVSDQAFTHELDELTVAEDMVKKKLKSINVSKSPWISLRRSARSYTKDSSTKCRVMI